MLIDLLTLNRDFFWAGKGDEVAFLGALYDLAAIPSHDYRFKTAAQDIRQHRINDYDWEDDWVFTDPRFNFSSRSS
ncbi:hypothetical protein [Rhodococcus sp. 15-725-2-2b]|uniref:AbiJ-related protein n=1 Tax=Rhodococcus sp. 15-725-2-2b TaxID=2023139 RepID=UPI00211B6CE8|nr:hypothetical protein [Rhodococcus sp. 15-725-2-2b]